MKKFIRRMKVPFLLCIFTGFNIPFLCAQKEVNSLFPKIESWEMNIIPQVYTPVDLWDYIDGAAGGYLSQEFIDLHLAEYTRGNNTINVEIYRHSDIEHAFGIYAQERYSDYKFMNFGAEGYITGSSLNFVNDEYYVKIYGDSDEGELLETITELARVISKRINSQPQLPLILQLFPQEFKIPHTEEFISGSFLGHEFLNSVWIAKYQENGEEFSLFYIEKTNPEAAGELLQKYLKFTSQGESFSENQPLTIKDPYNGNVNVLQDGSKIFGIIGTDNPDILRKYLKTDYWNIHK